MSTIVQNPPYLRNPFAPRGNRIATTACLVDPARDPTNVLVAICLSVLIIVGMVAMRDDMLHWFLLPVFLCGALIGPDMVGWLRGKIDIFDPVGILGAYGYYFFFVAPLLTVMWDYHTAGLVKPDDWLDWVGWMSVLNVFGLLVYLVARSLLKPHPPQTVWHVNRPAFLGAISVALPLTLVFQIYIFSRFGGVLGFISTFSENRGDTDIFAGMGWQFLIGELFPIFLVIAILVWKRDVLRQRSSWFLAALVCAFFFLKLLCGGLRGSRSFTVWGMFWVVGAIHFWVRRIPRKGIAIGLLLLIVFMYYYGFYKERGSHAFDAIDDPSEMQQMEEENARTMDTVLLGDMARTEIQSYLLYRLREVQDYDYGLGTTYLEAFDLFIPKAIWPDRPDGKVRKGTEALYGRDIYSARLFRASQVYGLAGEWMLNFGPFLTPVVFLILALAVSRLRNLMLADAGDLRWLIFPMLVNGVVVLLVGDLDNLLTFGVFVVLGPFMLLQVSSRRSVR